MAAKTTTPKNYEALAAKAPTKLHEEFAHWLFIQTGVKVDVKTVQLAVSFRMDFQASPENQANLAERKAKAAAAKKASAAKKKAKLEAELAKLAGKVEEPVAEELTEAQKIEAADKAEDASEKQDLTIVFGRNEPQVHKKGCADLRRMVPSKGFTKQNVQLGTYDGLTLEVYSDMIRSGETTLAECSGGLDIKPCCPALV